MSVGNGEAQDRANGHYVVIEVRKTTRDLNGSMGICASFMGVDLGEINLPSYEDGPRYKNDRAHDFYHVLRTISHFSTLTSPISPI